MMRTKEMMSLTMTTMTTQPLKKKIVNFQALDPQPPVVGLENPKQPSLLSKSL